MKLLVTGGAGFIGSNFIEFMLDKYDDIDITCLDLLTYAGNISNLDNVINDKRLHFYQGDINDETLLDKLYNQHHFKIIINFAAETHVDNSIKDSKPFVRSNILGVQTLLELTRKYNLYFHQISTDEVYGGKDISDDIPYDINSPLNPTNPYAASKAGADLLTLSYYHTYNLKVTISRSSNNYGPHQHQEKFIPHSLKLIKNNQKIEVYGDGKEKRDYIPVNFHVYCIDLIINNPTQLIYNICSEKEYSSLEVAKEILKRNNLDENYIKFIPNRLGHDGHYPMKSSFDINKFYQLKSNKI